MDKQERTLEEAFEELNVLITKMDQTDIPLDESFQLYKEGIGLIEFCNQKIDRVEKEMIILNGETIIDED